VLVVVVVVVVVTGVALNKSTDILFSSPESVKKFTLNFALLLALDTVVINNGSVNVV
jgi:hypothetical protein